MPYSDNRPNVLVYAHMSNLVYQDLSKGQTFPDEPSLANWRVYEIYRGRGGYFGALFINAKNKQLVMAHRGTRLEASASAVKVIWEDFISILRNHLSTSQRLEIFDWISRTVQFINDQKELGSEFQLSFCGHSLGAFLAELSVFFCHNDFKFPDVNAVTFESPGSRETMETLQSHLLPVTLR